MIDPVWFNHLRDLADHFDKSDQKSRNLSEEQIKELGDLAKSPMGNLLRDMADGFDAKKQLLEQTQAKLAAAQEAGRQIAHWAWVPCDHTISCPCCGAAWWPDSDDPNADVGGIDDDWHLNGCEFYKFWCDLGFGTGKRVSQGVRSDDPQSTYKTAQIVARERELSKKLLDVALELSRRHRKGDVADGDFDALHEVLDEIERTAVKP